MINLKIGYFDVNFALYKPHQNRISSIEGLDRGAKVLITLSPTP